MALVGRWLSIESFKHDGSFHRFWDRGLVLEDTPEYIVVGTKKAKVTENNGRKWFTKEPAITIFSKTDWWNAICMIRNDGICYYCNLASPCIVENYTIKYIDYDLDVKLFQDKQVKILDEKEYQFHKESFKYGEEIDLILRYQTKEIENAMKSAKFPFSDKIIYEYYEKLLNYFSKISKE